jgi:hypothetical protein
MKKNKDTVLENPIEFQISSDKAQPLMVLEYLNSWGNEFLFIFLLITSAFLLLFVNMVESSLPETVPTVMGFDVPSYWATQVPIVILIIAAVGLAIYYNMRRKYIETMMYMIYQKTIEIEARKSYSSRKPVSRKTSKK